MNNFLFFAIPFCLLLSETTIIKSVESQIGDTTGSSYVRTCPDYVDSCIYVCSDGFLNVCHPNQLYPIGLEPTGLILISLMLLIIEFISHGSIIITCG